MIESASKEYCCSCIRSMDLAENQKKYARQLLPTYDLTFKLLMGNEQHTHLLIHLLNSIPVSEDPIVSVVIENSELPPDNVLWKFYRLDIRATTNKGETIIVEMATSEEAGTVTKFVQYVTRTFSNQLKKGENYTKLKKTIGVMIADFSLNVFKNDEFFWRRVRLNDERTGTNLTPLLEMYIVELPKMKQVDEKHPLTYWIEFLRNPYSKETEKACKKVPEIKEAMEMYEKLKADPETIDMIIRREMAEQEYEGALNDARREAMEKGRLAGREEGRLAGREEGARRNAIENAKNMLKDKMPVELVAKYSGISIEQVKSISI